MKRIVVDAGATKTDFTVLVEDKIFFRYSGTGINPNYMSEAEILRVWAGFVQANGEFSEVDEIFYYGAGCASQQNVLAMKALILRFFPLAAVEVYSDLVAVCHALSSGHAAVVSILGTGSSSCLYNGETIVNRAPSLGYMLGDEGSGTNLGKRLLTTYLRGQLPDDLSKELEQTYQLSFETVIHSLYKEPEPNKRMAQMAPFMQRHINHPVIRQLANEAFNDFFAIQKKYYPQDVNLPWHISGSIAYYFQDSIKQAAENQHCMLGRIVAAPMEKLIEYYKNKR